MTFHDGVPGMTLETTRTVTARGLPAGAWRPVLDAAPALPPLPPPGTPVVLVAAHPGDETLGAAALLHRLAARGGTVAVLLVTDGEAAYPGRSAAERSTLAGRRRTEARAALDELGLGHSRVLHLGLPDSAVEVHEDALADRLAGLLPELLGGCQPDGRQSGLVLLPWRHDPHPDHAATARAVLDALALAAPSVRHWEYPIRMRHGTPPNDPAATGLAVARLAPAEGAARRAAIARHAGLVRSPYPEQEPALPGHVLELFDDGLEPWFPLHP